jgi:Protein of unknown function (DUF2914)
MFLSTGIAFLLGTTSFPGEPAASPKPVVEIAAGYRVINRKLEPVETDNVFVASDMVVVWTSLVGVQAGFIEHVWRRDGIEVARHYLPVGNDRRWRTWSRHRVDPGEYEVTVLGPDGMFLAKTSFTVAAEVDDAC